MAADPGVYRTLPLSADTWDDFAGLVEANNGVKEIKRTYVRSGTLQQILVYAGDECVGWCQYGSPAELPNIKNRDAYTKQLVELPERWMPSAPPAVGWSRPTRSRSRAAPRSVVPISIPDP